MKPVQKGADGKDVIEEEPDGDYNITIDDLTFTFSNAQHAPPMGLTANNYARCALIFLVPVHARFLKLSAKVHPL